ncbi:hypothetical protein JCM3765_004715 [Sporobolomyces pararoseus]
MSTGIPQHVPCTPETATGEAQCAIEVPQIDRLSRLPPELLDFIFELAAETGELATLPPSKYLRRHHERALYRSLSIGNHETLTRLATTLHGRPSRGHHMRRMNFESGTGRVAYLCIIEPGLVNLVNSLRICCLVQLSSEIVRGFSRIPDLRLVEFSYTRWNDHWEEDEGDQRVSPSAPQVKEVVIKSTNYARETQISDPSKLIQYFPNAALVTVDLTISCRGDLHLVKSLIQSVSPALRSLPLQYPSNDSYFDEPLIDELLPNFPHLRHLHLDPPLYAYHSLKSTLAPLKSLVTLSLGFSKHLHPPFVLVNAVRQLPLLREIKIEYFGIEEGDKFDIELAESQLKKLGRDLDECEELPALEVVGDPSEMKYWRFPFGWNASDTLLGVVEMEQQLEEELGLTVSSNLEQIRRAYHRQLVEFANREIGSIYFYGHGPEEDEEGIYWIAEQHGLSLPPLEVDLSRQDLLLRDTLEWYKVDMTEIVGDGGGECIGLGLRYKEGVKLEETEKSELNVAKGSNSSDDSAGSGAR